MKRKKIAISVPEVALKQARAAVRLRRAPSVSAYFARAVALQADADSMAELIEELKREGGEPTRKDYEWARRSLGLSS